MRKHQLRRTVGGGNHHCCFRKAGKCFQAFLAFAFFLMTSRYFLVILKAPLYVTAVHFGCCVNICWNINVHYSLMVFMVTWLGHCCFAHKKMQGIQGQMTTIVK